MTRNKKQNWLDVSVLIKTGMVHWPNDPAVDIRPFKSTAKGDSCNVSTVSMGTHTGTHMDPPFHFIPTGKTLDQMPLEATIGPARVIEIKDRESIKVEELRRHRIQRGERILFKTVNSARCWKTDQFQKDFVHIPADTARFLAKQKVRTIGVDYLSIGGFKKDGAETHRALLGAGVWVIEGLNLSKVRPGRYQLICLPIKILAADGAPARAVLKPL